MNKQDQTVLLISVLVSIIIFGLIFMFFAPEEKTLVNFISIIGTLITMIALAFSIHQQIEIKKTSELIEENSKNYQDSIRSSLYSWNITRAISLTEKLEDLLPKDENILTSIFVLKEIQGILSDCKKAVLIHYSNELENCLNCLEGKIITKEQITKILSGCKIESEHLWSEKFTYFNSELSAENFNLLRKLENQHNDFNKEEFLKKIIELRNFLQSIKPDYLTLTKPK
ncbi:MAG: hypothetical protein V4585_17585 [Bacteroidota bacterium]